MDIEQTVFTIITHSGEARNLFMKAIKCAKEDNSELARKYLEEAEDKLTEAHKKQSALIHLEASGQNINPTILLVHGQDHLMSAMLMKDLTEEFIELYSRLNTKSEKEKNSV